VAIGQAAVAQGRPRVVNGDIGLKLVCQSRVALRSCPAEILKTEAACYPFILIDVFLIIVVNELMPERLTKNNPRKYDKTNAQSGGKATRVTFMLV
jgi:hypothetical protein